LKSPAWWCTGGRVVGRPLVARPHATRKLLVVGHEPDGEGAAPEPGQLQEHHLLEPLLQVRVQPEQQQLRAGKILSAIKFR
jgi:hypothetical protein